jgi:hypothetical protein
MVATAMLNPVTPTKPMAIVFLVAILMVAIAKMVSDARRIYSDNNSKSILTVLSL